MPTAKEQIVSPVMEELLRATTTEFVPLLTDIAKIKAMWKLGHFDAEIAMAKIDEAIGDSVTVMVPLKMEDA